MLFSKIIIINFYTICSYVFDFNAVDIAHFGHPINEHNVKIHRCFTICGCDLYPLLPYSKLDSVFRRPHAVVVASSLHLNATPLGPSSAFDIP